MLLLSLVAGPVASAQRAAPQGETAGPERSSAVSGVVVDPSGAAIPGAAVVLHPLDGGAEQTVIASAQGRFTVRAAAGEYTLFASAPQFTLYSSQPLQLRAGKTVTLTVRLRIDVEAEQVDVSGEAAADTSAAGNSLVLKGDAVDRLPLDPTELREELQALAGAQNPEIWVNGFSGGSIPPRDTIREIRINQNPYSAMNDVNPVNGRIEIMTKPGSAKLSGSLASFGTANPLNSRDLFAPNQPPYHTFALLGNVSGPLRKELSYFASGQFNDFAQNVVVNAQTLDANGNPVTVQQAVPAPNTIQEESIRLDTMLGSRNTFSARYEFARTVATNGGVGQLVLPSAGYSNRVNTGTLQLLNSAVLTPHIVNDTRFQYIRSRTHQAPNSGAPAVVVEGVFTGGGSNAGEFHDNLDRYELQNYTMIARGKHYFSLGGRFRATRDSNSSTANFNGTYTFSSLAAYGQALSTGTGASQYSVTTGTPGVVVTVADLGLFAQDDWKIRPTFTLSSGLRFETQNHIGDHYDFGPRLAFSWNLGVRKGKPPLLVLRGASGLFFQRLGVPQVLEASRDNGVLQQSYTLNDPGFFSTSAFSGPGNILLQTAALPPTVYAIDPRFHAPYLLNSTVILEHGLGSHGSISASYLNTRGMRLLLTRNVNAPLPGTYNPQNPASGVRPLGGNGNVYQYASEGISNSNRFSTSLHLRLWHDRLFGLGYLEVRHDLADTMGGFLSNQYDPGQDYGRTPDDHRLYGNLGLGGNLPHGVAFFLLFEGHSGSPFDITLGQDLNGDSIFNDRPTFATDLTRGSVVRTAYGNFDTSPMAGQTPVPVNFGTGPGYARLNLFLSRRFGLGPRLEAPAATNRNGKQPEAPHRYSLALAADAFNLLNNVSLAPPIGTLNSPLFGHSVALVNGGGSGNRVINLQASFSF